MSFLRHPVTFQGLFRRCFLVNFAIPEAAIKPLIPSALRIDQHQGRAFLSLVVALVMGIKPKAIPYWSGADAWHVVYRVPVTYDSRTSGRLRGVFFLRSDTDNRALRALGNLFTYFRVRSAAVRVTSSQESFQFVLRGTSNEPADIAAEFDLLKASGNLPASSAFSSLSQAQEFLVERYQAFGVPDNGRSIDIVPIERTPWNLRVVPLRSATVSWLDSNPALQPKLDSVFYAENISYRWLPARTERIS